MAEAPLWGNKKGKEKYFYNSKSMHSQFFYESDLNEIYSKEITNKSELISAVNDLGIIILDISPFPFNPATTAISYRKDEENRSIRLKRKDYHEIIQKTFPSHVKPKLEEILTKIIESERLKFSYRYSRVQKLNKSIACAFKEFWLRIP